MATLCCIVSYFLFSICYPMVLLSCTIPTHLIFVSSLFFFFLMIRRPPRSTLFPYNDALPICRIQRCGVRNRAAVRPAGEWRGRHTGDARLERDERCYLPAAHQGRGARLPLLPWCAAGR